LVQTAKKAVEQWRYLPATLNDRPIPSTVVVEIFFGDRKK